MPRRSNSSSRMTLPRRCRPVKTAPLSVRREAGSPNVFAVAWKTWATSTLDGAKAGGGEGDSRAVVEEVQDLDRAAVGQRPGGGVGRPGFVGQLGGKADEGRLGPFLGLRRDEAVAFEDAPDGGHRWRLAELLRQ